jgi:hypothetical protein
MMTGMKAHLLRSVAATAPLRPLMGVLLTCVFLWGFLCCEALALSSEMHVSTENVKAAAHSMCHDNSDSVAVDCDCLHTNKSFTLTASEHHLFRVSLVYTLISPWEIPISYAVPNAVAQHEPRPPPDVSGPPVFYASTVLLI